MVLWAPDTRAARVLSTIFTFNISGVTADRESAERVICSACWARIDLLFHTEIIKKALHLFIWKAHRFPVCQDGRSPEQAYFNFFHRIPSLSLSAVLPQFPHGCWFLLPLSIQNV